MHAISPSPSPSSRSSCDGIIDAEFVERDASSAPPRIDPTPQRLALKMGPRAQPSLFDLPPELDPRRLIEAQREALAHMLHVLEHGPPAPDPNAPPPPPPETPEEFLERSMALLDRHIESLDANLERIVGRQWLGGGVQERKP